MIDNAIDELRTNILRHAKELQKFVRKEAVK